MSTATTPTAAATSGTPGEPTGPKVGFLRLLGVELRKLVDTTAGRWVFGAIIIVTALALLLIWVVTPAPLRSFAIFLQGAVLPLGFLLPILGVMAATSEWSQRTGLITFTLEPRRIRVAVAKLLAAVILGALATALAVALAALLTAAGATPAIGAEGVWSLEGSGVGGMALSVVVSLLMGVAFGMLIPITWLALVVYYLLPNVLSALFLWERLQPAQPWIDVNFALAPFMSGQPVTTQDWQHLASTLGLWVVLPIVVGTWLWCRREVK